MRQGMNPLRTTKISKLLPPAVPVVAVITHLPHYNGYHRERFEIVIQSARQAKERVGMDCYFVVWDNGSDDHIKNWLIDTLKPDMLILSENIGIANAMRRILCMFSDSIVALSNDDIFYEQGWLKSQIEILKAYPNVGTVSGVTTRFYMGKATHSTERWVMDNKVMVHGAVVPPLWDEQHALSVGKARHAAIHEFGNMQAPLISYNDVKAVIGGNHCQFVCYADRILPLLPNDDMYMTKLFPFDIRVNDAGLLRLLTPQRTARHVGNVLSDEDRKAL